MVRRWLPVGLLAAGLIAVNVAGRITVRVTAQDDVELQDRLSLATLLVTGLVFAVVAFFWSQRYPAGRFVGDVAAAGFVAVLVIGFLTPFVSGEGPFESGAGAFFSRFWAFGGAAIVGTGLGYVFAIAFGLDHRSKSLKRFAESRAAKPRKVVRR